MSDKNVGQWLTSVRQRLSGRQSRQSECELDAEPFSTSLSVNALQARFVERDQQGWRFAGTAHNDSGKTFQLWSRGSQELQDLILPAIRATSRESGGLAPPSAAEVRSPKVRPIDSRAGLRSQPGTACGHIARRRHQPPRAS